MARTAALLFLLCALFAVIAFSATNSYVPLTQFVRNRNFTLKFNVNQGYADISATNSVNAVRVFLAMPYLVYAGNIHYLHQATRFNRKGEAEIPSETARLIAALLKPSAVTVAASSSSVPGAAAVSSSSSSIEMNPTVISQKEGFTPVNAIILDPGHGGKDPGGLGVNGIKEKEIVLSIMKQLGLMIVKQAGKSGIKVFVTRNTDRFVSLKERTDLATELIKKNYHPVFVSIHGNISLNRKTAGIEVYSLSDKASDEEALSVETMENAGFSKSDVEKTEALSLIINDLLKDGIRSQSLKLAQHVGRGMHRTTLAQVRGVKRANFFVLKYNSMPSILIEVGFMSNPREGKLLLNRDYQRKLAAGIYNGIIDFLNEYNKSRGFTK